MNTTPHAALVTGASSGLGREIAIELARGRRHVILIGRDESRLRETARDVAAGGGTSEPVSADVREPAALREAIGTALRGRSLDIVVHAAGVLKTGDVASAPLADLREMLETNIVGSAAVVQATLPHLEKTRGRVVLVVSITGILALPGGFGAYAASKWGLRGYGETIRPELAARGVGLTLAFPSILDTPMVRNLGENAPTIYRAFPWHPPGVAARCILEDAAGGRDSSYLTVADRLAALGMGIWPSAFSAGLRAFVHWKSARR